MAQSQNQTQNQGNTYYTDEQAKGEVTPGRETRKDATEEADGSEDPAEDGEGIEGFDEDKETPSPKE